MGESPTSRTRRTRVRLQSCVTPRGPRNSYDEEETPNAVGLSQTCMEKGGEQVWLALFTRFSIFRKSSSYHIIRRSRCLVFLLLASSAYYAIDLPAWGLPLHAVKSDNAVADNLSFGKDFPRVRGAFQSPASTDTVDKGRIKRPFAASHATRPKEKARGLHTSPHGGNVRVSSRGRRSLSAHRLKQRSPAKRIHSSAIKHNAKAQRLSASSIPRRSATATSAKKNKKLHGSSNGGNDRFVLVDSASATRGTTKRTATPASVSRTQDSGHRRQRSPQVLRTEKQEAFFRPAAASPAAALRASFVEGRHALEEESTNKSSYGTVLSGKNAFPPHTVQASNIPLQGSLQYKEDLNSASTQELASQQLQPLFGAALLRQPEATVVPTALSDTTKASPAAAGNADSVVNAHEIEYEKLYRGLDLVRMVSPTLATPTLAPEATPIPLSAFAQQPPAVVTGDSQALPAQQTGGSAYGGVSPAQSPTTQPTLPPEHPVSASSPPETGAAAMPLMTRTAESIPLALQQSPSSIAANVAGLQPPTITERSGGVDISSPAAESTPPSETPSTIVDARAAFLAPPAAAVPPGLLPAGPWAAGNPTAELSAIGAVTAAPPAISITVPSSITAPTVSVPPFITSVPAPGAAAAPALPAPELAAQSESSVMITPLPPQATVTVESGAATSPTEASRATARQAEAETSIGSSESGRIAPGSEGGKEGKARAPPHDGAFGALLPPTPLKIGEGSATPNGSIYASEETTSPSGTVAARATSSEMTCLNTCDCFGLIFGGFTSLVVCVLAVLIATLLMSRLFSKGFFSVAFFRGGAYAILAAAMLGLAIGGLTGGLIRRCWPGSLYFGGGLMSFFASLVLLGKRGAWVGALGGVITGGSIGGLASAEALPISLGCVVGLLLGIVLGFAPILRDLKMNTRYIRYGFETRQPSLQRGDTTAGASRAESLATKRLSQRLFSSPTKTSSLRTTASSPSVKESVGRRAESFPSSS